MAATNDVKNFVTMKAKNQLAKQAIEHAVPEYFKSKYIKYTLVENH